jgi:hypothetical protein
MRIYYPVEGPGCRVVVSQGFIEGFCDDHPGSRLQGLEGMQVFFDGDLHITKLQFRNGTLRQWEGPDLVSLVKMAREMASEQPKKASGERPAIRLEPEAPAAPPEASLPPLPPPVATAPKTESVGRYVVIRRRAGSSTRA